jgi:hypothetical protein
MKQQALGFNRIRRRGIGGFGRAQRHRAKIGCRHIIAMRNTTARSSPADLGPSPQEVFRQHESLLRCCRGRLLSGEGQAGGCIARRFLASTGERRLFGAADEPANCRGSARTPESPLSQDYRNGRRRLRVRHLHRSGDETPGNSVTCNSARQVFAVIVAF